MLVTMLGKTSVALCRITPDVIKVVEVVEDASGNWTNREAEIVLNDSGNSGK